MTRRQLARHLAKDVTARGLHYVNGSTIWCTIDGAWGANPGQTPPHQSAAFYEWMGYDQVAERNDTFKIETALKQIEKRHTGKAPRVDRRSLGRK